MPTRKLTIKSSIARIPPQNLEAEQSVLGSVMLSKNALIKISDKVSSEDFYETQNKEIYQAMLELFEKRRPIDVVTLTDHLESKKKLKEVGGASYLTNLVNSVPSAAHVTHYAEIVHNKGVLRRLTEAAETITDLSYRENDEVNSLLDKAEQALFSVSQKYTNQAFVALKDILAETFERIDELHKGKGKIRGVATGFRDLDNLLAGFQPSDLVILASRPSMGKTSLAINIAQHIAVKGKTPVAIFSLEQSKEQLVDRMLCGEAGVDGWKLRTGNLRDDDFPKIGHAMGILSEAPIYIDDQAFCNVMEIRAKARRLQMEKGIGLIVVDYLQLMQGTTSSRDPNRVQEISEISRGLKALARELNVPVLALSQLSRAVEQRPKHIPQLSDLRESGSIEQDADVVMFIYREDYYDKDTERKNIADVLIKKHRNGPIGSLELYFIPEQTQFQTIERKREGE